MKKGGEVMLGFGGVDARAAELFAQGLARRVSNVDDYLEKSPVVRSLTTSDAPPSSRSRKPVQTQGLAHSRDGVWQRSCWFGHAIVEVDLRPGRVDHRSETASGNQTRRHRRSRTASRQPEARGDPASQARRCFGMNDDFTVVMHASKDKTSRAFTRGSVAR